MMAYDYLDLHARQQPNSEFAVGVGKHITYREARDAVNRIAQAMIASQLGPGDRVAILMGNSIETVLVFLGALKAGVVPAPINCRLKPSDWLRICEDSEARLLVSDAQFTEDVESFRGQLERVCCFIRVGGPCTGWQDFEGLIEVAIVDRAIVRNADHAATHQVRHVLGVEMIHEKLHIGLVFSVSVELMGEPLDRHVRDREQAIEDDSKMPAELLAIRRLEFCLRGR